MTLVLAAAELLPGLGSAVAELTLAEAVWVPTAVAWAISVSVAVALAASPARWQLSLFVALAKSQPSPGMKPVKLAKLSNVTPLGSSAVRATLWAASGPRLLIAIV